MKQPITRFGYCAFALLTLTACGGGAAGPVSVPTNAAQYDQAVSDAVARSTRIPPSLAGSGVSGVTHIQIILSPDGTLASAAVSQSSGTTGLDNFALDGVENAKFPVLPAGLPQADQQFDIPVNFGPPGHASP